MLTVYGRATSSNVQAVMWGIGELGLAYERLDCGHVYGGLDTPEYLAMNPNGRVPTLRDGDLVIWESCAILRYLAARYGDGGAFWPADPVARAPVDMWAEWAKASLAVSFTVPIFWSRVRSAADKRDEAALSRGIAEFEGYLDILEAQLNGRSFVVGEDFSLADIVVGHVLYRWFDIDIPRKPRPVLERYFAALCDRPAYQAHVMIDYSILRVPGA